MHLCQKFSQFEFLTSNLLLEFVADVLSLTIYARFECRIWELRFEHTTGLFLPTLWCDKFVFLQELFVL